MNFLTRIFSREAEEVAETISRAEHEEVVASLRQDARALDALAGKYKRERDAARIEAAAYADDAQKYRRSLSNLKQFRKAG